MRGSVSGVPARSVASILIQSTPCDRLARTARRMRIGIRRRRPSDRQARESRERSPARLPAARDTRRRRRRDRRRIPSSPARACRRRRSSTRPHCVPSSRRFRAPRAVAAATRCGRAHRSARARRIGCGGRWCDARGDAAPPGRTLSIWPPRRTTVAAPLHGAGANVDDGCVDEGDRLREARAPRCAARDATASNRITAEAAPRSHRRRISDFRAGPRS